MNSELQQNFHGRVSSKPMGLHKLAIELARNEPWLLFLVLGLIQLLIALLIYYDGKRLGITRLRKYFYAVLIPELGLVFIPVYLYERKRLIQETEN